ncbi:MAG: hypothetical protein ACODAJ_01205, partial [Planctomycetota bacterium]
MGLRTAPALIVLALAAPAGAATVRGVVTGDVGHLPWRKGRRERGWCTVKAYRHGIVLATTRTNTRTGDFDLEVSPGPVEVVVSRPGFLPGTHRLELGQKDPAPLRFHLKQDPDYGLIVAPRTGAAATAAWNDGFVIECLAPPTARGWAVSLVTEHFERELKLRDAKFQDQAVWSGTKPGWRLHVHVPASTPLEMYDLRVSHLDAEGRRHQNRQARA